MRRMSNWSANELQVLLQLDCIMAVAIEDQILALAGTYSRSIQPN
jgi:hypothetical protein